jgi:hypothetical protein
MEPRVRLVIDVCTSRSTCTVHVYNDLNGFLVLAIGCMYHALVLIIRLSQQLVLPPTRSLAVPDPFSLGTPIRMDLSGFLALISSFTARDGPGHGKFRTEM